MTSSPAPPPMIFEPTPLKMVSLPRVAKEIVAAATLDSIVALAAPDAGENVHTGVNRDLIVAGSTIDDDTAQWAIVVDESVLAIEIKLVLFAMCSTSMTSSPLVPRKPRKPFWIATLPAASRLRFSRDSKAKGGRRDILRILVNGFWANRKETQRSESRDGERDADAIEWIAGTFHAGSQLANSSTVQVGSTGGRYG